MKNKEEYYTYDGRGSVSAVIGTWGDFRASYWYDGLGNVKSQIHGYGAFGSGKKYYGYNAEQYNPVTGNQNLRARQVNIRRQRFLTEDTYLGQLTNTLSINRYTYAESNPLKYKDPSGYFVGISAFQLAYNYFESKYHFAEKTQQYVEQRGARQGAKRAINIFTDNSGLADELIPNENIIDDILSNDFIYYNRVKPGIQNKSDNVIRSIDEDYLHGGQGVASFIHSQSDRITSLTDVAKAYSEVIQKCADNFSEETLDFISKFTKELGGFDGFKTITDNNKKQIITTNYWTWHGMAGYSVFYDKLFHDFTPTDHDRIQIGNEYTIWLWKGDYLNLGAGGEIGIYSGTGDDVATTMSAQLNVGITMDITDRDGNSIVSIGRDKNVWDMITGNNPNENWWLTGWNPKAQGLTNKDLVMTGTLDFSNATDPTLYNKLKATYELGLDNPLLSEDMKSTWQFDDKKKKATFRWEY